MFDLNEKRKKLWISLLEYLGESNFLDAEEVLTEIYNIERFWSFPGKEVLDQIYDYAIKKQQYLAETLVTNVLNKIETINRRYFRPYGGNLEQLNSIKYDRFSSSLEKKKRNSQKKPCFEVLIFHPDPYNYYYLYYNSLNGCQSERDEFFYDIIFVNNLADAALALVSNDNIQACIGLSGCDVQSDYIESNKWLESLFKTEKLSATLVMKDSVKMLERVASFLRPEIETYYISELNYSELPQDYFSLFDKVFYHISPFKELHHAIMNGVRRRLNTPFYNALYSYSQKPKTVFHALPISQGGSIKNSVWTKDFYDFYGENIFDAETSSTQRGLDSLLNPKGPIKNAQDIAARTFGADKTFFVTNGTSTSNKIVMQANLRPGDIVFVSSDCHKSVPYGVVLSGASVIFLQTNAIEKHDLYGAIPLEQIKKRMRELEAIGELSRLKQIVLTNCTFDGLTYDVRRYMLEILSIKPDIIFHWDEAWFAHAHFHPLYRNRHAMGVTRDLQALFQSSEYRETYENAGKTEKNSLPDPDLVRLRVYATQSTHKTLSSFRQGSMIHIIDEEFNQETFQDAFYTHTSTSPNYQILASLDIARRQVEIEGYSIIQKSISLANWLRKSIRENEKISKVFKTVESSTIFPTTEKSVKKVAETNFIANNDILDFQDKGMLLDPTRLTLDISKTGLSGGQFRKLLINRYNIQVNKTSHGTVLFIVNIAATRKSIEYLYRILTEIVDLLMSKDHDNSKEEMKEFPSMPQERSYHSRYLSYEHEMLADIRQAYYDSYSELNTEYLLVNDKSLEQAENGITWVCALFITPYPPGFPLLVPGQVINLEMLKYMSNIINDEIHGLNKDLGIKVFRKEFLEGK